MRLKDTAKSAALSDTTSFEITHSHARDTGDLEDLYHSTYTSSTSDPAYVWCSFSKTGSALYSTTNLQRPTSHEMAANCSSLSRSLYLAYTTEDH